MRALFFVSALDSGGLENYLLRFLTENHSRFEEVYVWCKSGREGQLDSAYLELGNVFIVKVKLGYFGFSPYWRLRRFIVSKKIDVVCDFSGNFSGRVMAVSKRAGVFRRVSSYREASSAFKENFAKKLYSSWVRHLVYKYSTNIVSNSRAALDQFFPEKWVRDKRFSVIYNGVDPKKHLHGEGDMRSELCIPDNAYVVGHTGRFNAAKNHTAIIAVAEILVAKYPDIYFVLCGNGVRSNLEAGLKSKGLMGRVFVFDNRSDIRKFLNTMDCYLFPSITEGQPNALIEAMMVGLPFVASDIPPIRETVGDAYPLYPALDYAVLAAAVESKYLARDARCLEQQREMLRRFDSFARFNEFYDLLKGE